ncbi:MAG TPA: ATP-dependent Clp protease proteolytic subunit [Pseudonocardia sp.]|jgi:ATP-dependent Clp protease protease subunit|uniref:ClpP family protease n=1 Tax=Pseudonocardia sp. TaxID=60912 RepID=UPI002B4B6B28|nr:ATP-dependent Clp protease proteolytic subunit [Pseudonocardia sp.]HLU54202.1 ATP-dependent Clp protease proteolytic subunit [Pseudonocardia sp.]
MTVRHTVHHAVHQPQPPLPPYPPLPPQRPAPPPAQPRPPVAGPVLHAEIPIPAGADPLLPELLGERIVYIGREIDDEVATLVNEQLLLLAAQDPDRDVALYLNAPGGSVTAALAVYDTMRSIRPDVATWAVGITASAGQFLLSAGTPGKRYAMPHARILMSRPTAGGGGRAVDVAMRAGVHAELKREIAELTARHTGQTVEAVVADCDRERWFTAEQAREYGLVDHVVEG